MWLTSSLKDSVNFGLIKQLRMLALQRLQFDGHLLAGVDVGSSVDFAEGPAPYFHPDPKLSCYSKFHSILNQQMNAGLGISSNELVNQVMLRQETVFFSLTLALIVGFSSGRETDAIDEIRSKSSAASSACPVRLKKH